MKKRKKKTLAAYEKQYKGRCPKCRKYGHKSTDPGCPEIKKKIKIKKQRKNYIEESNSIRKLQLQKYKAQNQ